MVKPLPSRGDIVRCLTEAERGLHAREIAKRCNVGPEAYPHLLELLDQLSFDGTLRRVSGNRFEASDVEAGASWEGVLSVNPRGFGFVAAAGQEDVYIAPDGIGGALHGDRVRVSVLRRSNRGIEGRIEQVVARRNPRVAGVLRRKGKSTWLEPDDTRVRGPIVIAKTAQGQDGEAAVVAITRFPNYAEENPEGELVAVLGVPGDPNAEVAKILVREQITEEHPEAAVRDAEAMAARIQSLSLEHRKDLRNVPLPTIDPEDARDHDDAVWVVKSGDGYRAWIAIADVSEYVQTGSALDQEAESRGCTIYLPDRAIPMLPAALAADLCSLLPDRDRLCVCVIAELDRNAEVTKFEIVEGVMRSAAMLTYGGVARALGFTEAPPKSAQAEALKRDLRCLDELARKLRRLRLKRGALDLNVPEARVEIDRKTGAPVRITRRAQDPGIKRAYSMVEELMILANEIVAQWLSKKRCPTVYRVHGRPDTEKLERLAEIARRLGAPVDLEDLLEPAGVSRWLDRIAEHPRRNVLEMLLLRSLKQAVYDIVNIGHFGLASGNYLHFTSPIRRYPDIAVHRAVKALLRGAKPDTSTAAIEKLRASATDSSMRERAAMDVEREVVDLHRCLLMRDRIGDVFEGTVAGVVGSGVFVSLDDPFVDVLVRYEALGPDRYELDDDELGVTGLSTGDRVQLGDRVAVVVDDVAVLRRSVYGHRVVPEHLASRPAGKRPRGRDAAPGAKPDRRARPPGKAKSDSTRRNHERRSPRGTGRQKRRG